MKVMIESLIHEAKRRATDNRRDQSLEERDGVSPDSEYSRGAADAWDDIVRMLERAR